MKNELNENTINKYNEYNQSQSIPILFAYGIYFYVL